QGALPQGESAANGALHREARGCSSDGRALQSHCRGQGFDSPQLHQPSSLRDFGWQASPAWDSDEGCPPKPLAKEGVLNYVYILQSISHPEQFYTGLCAEVQERFKAHNAGQSPHTSKFKPWRLLSFHYFADPTVAAAFERY